MPSALACRGDRQGSGGGRQLIHGGGHRETPLRSRLRHIAKPRTHDDRHDDEPSHASPKDRRCGFRSGDDQGRGPAPDGTGCRGPDGHCGCSTGPCWTAPRGIERRHKSAIDRFGRHPHRTVILGRPSTAEETAFPTIAGSSLRSSRRSIQGTCPIRRLKADRSRPNSRAGPGRRGRRSGRDRRPSRIRAGPRR